MCQTIEWKWQRPCRQWHLVGTCRIRKKNHRICIRAYFTGKIILLGWLYKKKWASFGWQSLNVWFCIEKDHCDKIYWTLTTVQGVHPTVSFLNYFPVSRRRDNWTSSGRLFTDLSANLQLKLQKNCHKPSSRNPCGILLISRIVRSL